MREGKAERDRAAVKCKLRSDEVVDPHLTLSCSSVVELCLFDHIPTNSPAKAVPQAKKGNSFSQPAPGLVGHLSGQALNPS